jgi:predicted acetyltransferase
MPRVLATGKPRVDPALSVPDTNRGMASVEVSAAGDPGDLEALAPIVAWAFNDSTEGSLKWLKQAPEHVRLAREQGRLVGGLMRIPKGHWFGGQRVSALGLAGVAVAATARGSGVALGMLREVFLEARAEGIALSSLYPSTVALYRKAGYELAGHYCSTKLTLAECPRFKSSLTLDELRPEDEPEVERLYAATARERSGYLDRAPYNWERVRKPRDASAAGFAARGAEGIEGYVYVTKTPPSGFPHDLRLSDFVAATPAAQHRLFDLLSCHRSTADHAVWYGGAADGRLLLLPDKIYQVKVEATWMLRILDVARALEQRGYPDVERELSLELSDDILPENRATYRLRVSGGHALVEPTGGAGNVRLDVRALSALYSGFVSAAELSRAGLLTGSPRSLATLGLLFGGPAPALADYF